MEPMMILKIIACLISIAFGAISILQPDRIAQLSGFGDIGEKGRAELRIAFGGYFIGLGIAPLLLNVPVAYQAVGIGWLGAGIVRILSALMGAKIDRAFIITGLVEFAVALALII